MKVGSPGGYLAEHKGPLIKSILDGSYRPDAVRRVEIPRNEGSIRKLGIPTVGDRVIQEAVSQQWSNLYEPQFSAHSYGFRPGRHAHQALEKCREYISAGYQYAVDMDLEKFFDTVNHSKLIELLSRTVKDSRVGITEKPGWVSPKYARLSNKQYLQLLQLCFLLLVL